MVIALSPGALLSCSWARIRVGEGILAEIRIEWLLLPQLIKYQGAFNGAEPGKGALERHLAREGCWEGVRRVATGEHNDAINKRGETSTSSLLWLPPAFKQL